MDFEYSEEQKMLAESIASWSRDNYSFEARQRGIANDSGYNASAWQAFADMGWLAMMFAEDDGGLDGGPVELMVLMRQFGAALIAEPFLANIVLTGGVLSRSPAGSSRDELIASIVSGDAQAALAFVEPRARYDLSNVETTAKAVDDGFLISGMKAVVLNGAAADKLLVVARTSGESENTAGLSILLVESNAPGVSVESYACQDGTRAADIAFYDVQVGNDALIGQAGEAYKILEEVIDLAAFAVAAEAVGIMHYMLNATVEYSKMRKQFGVPIGTFQALQHRMADMYNEVEQSRSILMWAAAELALGGETRMQVVSACKAYVGKAARLVGQESIQMHGGIGVTNELDVAHYFKRLTLIETLFGNTDFHTKRYANLHFSGH